VRKQPDLGDDKAATPGRKVTKSHALPDSDENTRAGRQTDHIHPATATTKIFGDAAMT